MSYQYPPQQQPQPQRAGFDLDDLLDMRTPQEKAAQQSSRALPPPSYPPPAVSDDPYAFAPPPPQVVQQPQAPPPPLPYQQQPPQQPYQPPQQPYTYPTPYPAATAPLQQQQPTGWAPQVTPAPQPQPYYAPQPVAQPLPPPQPVVQPQPVPQQLPPQAYHATAPPQSYKPYDYPQAQQGYPIHGTVVTGPPPPVAPYTGLQQPTASYPANQAYNVGYVVPSPITAPPPAATQPSAEEDADRIQLEKIMRLRKELEREQERERQKREESETWPCAECTYRNKLTQSSCEMCTAARPGHRPTPSTQSQQRPPSPPRVQPAPTSNVPPGSRWQCSVCGTANDAHVSNCTACNGFRSNGTPLPGASQPPPSNVRPCNTIPTANVRTNNTSPQPQQWECNVCTLMNPVNTAVCSACESGQRPRHLSPQPSQQAANQRPGQPPGPYAPLAQQHQQPHSQQYSPLPPQQQHYPVHHALTQQHQTPQPQAPSSWACTRCTFDNELATPTCHMCGNARPASLGPLPPTTGGQARPASSTAGQSQVPADEDPVQWQKDSAVTNCNKCNAQFSMLKRRHHCRICGFVFCHYCCSNKVSLKPGGVPEKVCIDCFKEKMK